LQNLFKKLLKINQTKKATSEKFGNFLRRMVGSESSSTWFIHRDENHKNEAKTKTSFSETKAECVLDLSHDV